MELALLIIFLRYGNGAGVTSQIIPIETCKQVEAEYKREIGLLAPTVKIQCFRLPKGFRNEKE